MTDIVGVLANAGLRVRDLEWRKIGEGYAGFVGSISHARIEHGWSMCFPYEYGGISYAQLDQAKAAAQADFTARILSALSSFETASKDAGDIEPYEVMGTSFDGVTILAPKTKSTKFTQQQLQSAFAALSSGDAS